MKFDKWPPQLPWYAFAVTVVTGLSYWINVEIQFSSSLRKSTFSHWEENQRQYMGRTIAAQSDQCQQGPSLEVLQTQVKQLEASLENGGQYNGHWQGLDLSTLPSTQAQLLSEHGDLIGDRRKTGQFKNCSDLICVINQIYQEEDPSIGYLVYYWYLRTGSMLSLSNTIPGQASNYPGVIGGENFELQSYLFTRDELVQFYQLARSLPESFLNIPSLKSLHKLPVGAKLSGRPDNASCVQATASGAILLEKECLKENKFFLETTAQLARFIDYQKDQLSSSSVWRELSIWIREDHWDPTTQQYQFRWQSHLPGKNKISDIDPTSQLARLVADYRFKPEKFQKNTSKEVLEFIQNNIFDGKTFDDKGLLSQYLNSSIKSWDRQEADLWQKCLDQHLDPKLAYKNPRDVASTIHNPLYECVEKAAETFEQRAIDELKSNQVDACNFFADQKNPSPKQFSQDLQKYIQEKLVQRKVEFKEYGEQATLGHQAKTAFKSSFDPKSLYISCIKDESAQKCYEQKTRAHAISVLGRFHTIQGHYKNVLLDELIFLFPYQEIADQTNTIAKRFLAPFYFQLSKTASSLWEECKLRRGNEKLDLPMQFTGGRYFVRSSVLNCVNQNLDSVLNELVQSKITQQLDDKQTTYQLNHTEQQLALEFIKPRLLNNLMALLEEQRMLEQNFLIGHFQKVADKALLHLKESWWNFGEVLSLQHAQDKCLDMLSVYYPDTINFHSRRQVGIEHGRSICSEFMETKSVKEKMERSIFLSWNQHKTQMESEFNQNFRAQVGQCYKDYPEQAGNLRNTRMMQICLADAFEQSLEQINSKWRQGPNFQYFLEAKKEVMASFESQRGQLLKLAWERQLP